VLETELSPCGEKEYTEVFDGNYYLDFTINVVDCGNEAWECSVMRRLVSAVQMHTVIIPKDLTKGLFFGQCTCGLVKHDAVPYEHMAAIVVSSHIGVLTRHNIMPYWWKRAQWQEQFPREVTAECYANMEVIRDDYDANDTIRYCPVWGKGKLSALKLAQGIKRKPKHLTRFCQICRGFSHRTIDCWLYRRKTKSTAPWHGRANMRRRSSRQRKRRR
jgi:hypothetical protein